MNIRNRDIIGCFPLLASVLADKYGVKIHMGGEQAKTDGNAIYIPAMPAELDDENLAMARGYVDHEAAHIRHTDFEALKKAGLDKLEAWLFNAIEDWRVEKKLAGVFPGCGNNFRKLIIKLFGKTAGTGRKNPVPVILDYVLLAARSWSVPEIAPEKKQTGEFLDGNFPGLKDGLDILLGEAHAGCASTEQAIFHARRIAAHIRQYFNANANQKTGGESEKEDGQYYHGNKKGQNYGGAATGTSPCPDGAGSQENHNYGYGKNGEDPAGYSNAEKESGIAESGFRQTASGNRQPENKNQTDAESGENEQNPFAFIKDEDMPQNLGDILSAKMDDLAVPEKKEGVVVARTGSKKVSAFSREEAREALQSSVALRQRLAGLLQAKAYGCAGAGRNGKLDSRHLHRVCVGDAHVFRRDMEKTALNTAVHILLDCSSSMSGIGIGMARKACYALVKSLTGTKGINLALTAFPADNDKTSVYPVIRHGQKLNSIPSFEAFGSTPLGPALWWAMANMLPLRENRKIILVLSDGVPNSVKAAQKAISQCQKLKMEVMGIGIQSQAISNLLPESGRTIWKLDELAAAMFELVRKALINGGAK